MYIGILTYHRSHNYGALLQAYALKRFLNKQGYNNVGFVDYFPDYHTQMYANERKTLYRLSLKQKIKYPLYLIRVYYPLYKLKEKRRNSFIEFIEKYLIETAVGITDKCYDVVIYGSDQIWRKQKQKTCPGFNEVYFGNDIIKAKRRIVFSASMGIIDLDDSDKEFLSKSFRNFASISVREKELYETIKSFSDYPIRLTLDPVFLLTKEDWEHIIPVRLIEENYILFYNLQENDKAIEIVKYISSKLGYKIIEVIGVIRRPKYPSHIKLFEGPERFLSLLKYADFIVTSSFHGVALSIIFEKQFYACLSANIQRVASLLSIFDIENRLIKSVANVNLENSINYSHLTVLVNDEKKRSIEYLCNSINN